MVKINKVFPLQNSMLEISGAVVNTYLPITLHHNRIAMRSAYQRPDRIDCAEPLIKKNTVTLFFTCSLTVPKRVRERSILTILTLWGVSMLPISSLIVCNVYAVHLHHIDSIRFQIDRNRVCLNRRESKIFTAATAAWSALNIGSKSTLYLNEPAINLINEKMIVMKQS